MGFLELSWINWVFLHCTVFNKFAISVSLLLQHFLNTEVDISSCIFEVKFSFHVSEGAYHQRKVHLL